MSQTARTIPLKVFVVENHPDTLQTLKTYLEDMGHDVTTASTITQALNVLPGINCDLLLCDIGLPDGFGWELMQKLPTKVFSVAMSGFGMNADSARSHEVGFRHHLLKPFKAAELDRIVDEAAAERARRENE
ncbi:MAG TPA: response regulator [Candidatus Kapabacteria bacterium]|nr:response regulator [Candidatus Kapabacteria bacterium]